MQENRLWKKWLLIIIWIGIILIVIFLVIKIKWAKDTAIEKRNDIKSSVNQWILAPEDANWLEETETRRYSIFVESDDDKDKNKEPEYNLEYNFDDYNSESSENNYTYDEDDYSYNYNY
jgi:hypothetical protein